MNHDEAEIIAKQILEQNGYKNCRIDSNIHTTGTNVRTIEATEGNVFITLTIDDNTGKLLDKKISKKYAVHLTESHIPVSDMLSVKTTLFFELNDKIPIGEKMMDAKDFELIKDEENSQQLNAFRILVNDNSDETITKAIEQAGRFTNYLTTITNIVVKHKRPRISIMKNGMSTNTTSIGVDMVIVKSQDLDMTKLLPFLSSDSRLQQYLRHYHDGLDAFLNNDFAEAIRNFYKIIENQDTFNSKKYKPLRDGISHEELGNNSTISGLEFFGIHIKKNGHVNLNDPSIQNILEKEASGLKMIVWNYLSSELQSL